MIMERHLQKFAFALGIRIMLYYHAFYPNRPSMRIDHSNENAYGKKQVGKSQLKCLQ